jgi:hypothetical protein
VSDGVLVALITVGLPMVGGSIAWLVTHLLNVRKVLGLVNEQVTNSHGSNLREDLDFMRDVLLDVRADMSWLRRDHQDLTRRVDRLEDGAAA